MAPLEFEQYHLEEYNLNAAGSQVTRLTVRFWVLDAMHSDKGRGVRKPTGAQVRVMEHEKDA